MMVDNWVGVVQKDYCDVADVAEPSYHVLYSLAGSCCFAVHAANLDLTDQGVLIRIVFPGDECRLVYLS